MRATLPRGLVLSMAVAASVASVTATSDALAARGASPAAFGRRCIPAGCVAPPSHTPGILSRRALPAGRLAGLGATPDLHHGLLANGSIRGRVELRQSAPDLARRPNVGDLGMPRAHDPTDRRRSVVYLETAPRHAFDQREDPRAKLDQRNEAFVPHVLAIVAGTTVDFPNNDETYHNVFSLSTTKSFDLGRYAVGHSKSVRFDRPGIIRVFCDIHSHMSAFILVFAHRYFAVTDDEGRFRLDNVPPGTYTVIAWNESAPPDSRRVVIAESGGDVEANFVLGRR